MNNLLLLVPESVIDSLTDMTGVTVMPLPSQCAEHSEYPEWSDVRKLAVGCSHAAVTATSDPEIIREMTGQLYRHSSDFQAAIAFSEEPLPSEIRKTIPECLLPFLRRPQPRDLFAASAGSPATASSGSLMNVLLEPECNSIALPRQPVIDRFALTGPGSGSQELDLKTLRSAIDRAMDLLKPSLLDRRCLEAGLLLLWDFLDESHHISQTMEGKGSPRTGDYWHGIMHRREPDAGNASYWFRRVGRHPALDHLGTRLINWMSELGATEPQMDLVRSKLLSSGTFDPFAMIQLSERALVYPDSQEDLTCRMVQYLEMLNLLAWSSGTLAVTLDTRR